MAISSAVLLTLALGFIGVLSYYMLRHFTYWRSKGIPYIQTNPLFGLILPVLLRKRSMPENTIAIYKACPGAKYYGSVDFGEPVLIVKDPEIVKDVTVKSFAHFPNHRAFFDEKFDPALSKNLFFLKDDRWRDMRSVLTPSFTANKMKYMFQLVSKCSMDFVQYLRERSEPTRDIDLKDFFTRYTNDVIATTAFGISVNSVQNRENEFYTNARASIFFEGFLNLIKFMVARFFPKLMRFMGFGFLPKKCSRFFDQIICDTVKMRDEKGIVRPDMIHLLMQARDNEKGIPMTNDDITAQAIIFLLAGFDTSARLMCFVSHVLSHHPDIQDQLRDEVDAILGQDDGSISYEKLGSMKYLDMVISETLRMYPPQPFTDRVCTEAYELEASTPESKPFTVAPGTLVWIPTLGFHHDPKYFPEPEEFKPERFSEENKNDIIPYSYLPFGIGPRKCIGDRFALMEAKIIIARLLQNFVFKPSEKTTKVITFARDGSIMSPENGFWMRLESRNKP
ncbi:cytochrome P450 9e2-like [Venturia canescens]|uniref:cytochrome P450 9e2-like n=1 Tax=Venturia canescens TaxID=32260 RepID=UPI001C9D15C9|nr:cytochrome P450 9e2-like [Venturia canescens]